MPGPRKPIALKTIAGTDRPVRRPKQSVGDRFVSAPPPPNHLSRRAKTEWRRIVPHIFAMGVLSPGDIRSLELLTETLATEADARDAVAKHGFTVATADGGLKPHPAVRAMETARGQAIQLLDRFGLNPKARQHVDIAPDRAAPNKFTVNRGPAQ